jgi:hypothetical protein
MNRGITRLQAEGMCEASTLLKEVLERMELSRVGKGIDKILLTTIIQKKKCIKNYTK